jgi:hypothetical protein
MMARVWEASVYVAVYRLQNHLSATESERSSTSTTK